MTPKKMGNLKNSRDVHFVQIHFLFSISRATLIFVEDANVKMENKLMLKTGQTFSAISNDYDEK